MSLLRKSEFHKREGAGYLAVVTLRLPFRAFSRKPVKVLFRPDFAGAKWYEVDTEAVDLEQLLAADNAYTAMAYLRNAGAA